MQTGHLSGLTGTAGQNQTLPHYADTTYDKNLNSQSQSGQREGGSRISLNELKSEQPELLRNVCGSESTAGRIYTNTHYGDTSPDKALNNQSQLRSMAGEMGDGQDWKLLMTWEVKGDSLVTTGS